MTDPVEVINQLERDTRKNFAEKRLPFQFEKGFLAALVAARQALKEANNE